MRFAPEILDEIRARLAVSQVVGRKVALKRKGREYSGLSPFKVEKTPSFFVNDQKGFYHCFASGEHGDIFTFLMKTEGLTFPEAVERLAGEAGVPLPQPTEREEARGDQRQRLYALLDAAQTYFEEQLKGPAGGEARRYLLDKRGLAPEAIKRFRLGYATPSRSALREHLAKAGFTSEEMAVSGMLISGDDIPVAYDRFRHRVMFPITDLKGRVIAFGGRALDPDAPAKYLNSPETPLFHKGHNLYNAHQARSPAFERGRIIAVEGYMDVVALSEAGFEDSVAPLGTALTEDQVKLLWRMVPEPILCFDGDSAGRKAAFRAVDTVLPHLRPGHSVRFAFLPDGLDPDDLIRQQGAAAMSQVLERARPLVDVLWEREWSSGQWSTPERRAQLEAQLRTLVGRIGDAAVRGHYEQEMRRRLAEALGDARTANGRGAAERSGLRGTYVGAAPQRRPAAASGRRGGGAGRFEPAPLHAHASGSLKSSRLVSGDAAAPPYREALILRAVLNHPWLIEEHAEELAELPFTSTALSRLRDAVLSIHALDNSLDTATLHTQLSKAGVGRVVDLVDHAITHRCDRFAEPLTERAEVDVGWRHALALHERQMGLRQSLAAAERAWHEDGSEEALARICEIQRQFALSNEPGDESGAVDTARADGGHRG